MKSRHEFGSPEQWYDYLRTYFAGQALNGLLAGHSKYFHGNDPVMIPPDVAQYAVIYAECLLLKLQE